MDSVLADCSGLKATKTGTSAHSANAAGDSVTNPTTYSVAAPCAISHVIIFYTSVTFVGHYEKIAMGLPVVCETLQVRLV